MANDLSLSKYFNNNTPLIMGILNVTPDSFSDGEQYLSIELAISRAKEIIAEGGDIIDIGGESSRPGSEPVSLDDEIERVIPVIKAIRTFSMIPISIDTTKSEVANLAIKSGADIINDISALRLDEKMIDVAIEFNAPVILMHMLGKPKTMQVEPHYDDCVTEVMQFLSERVQYCENKGVSKEKIIIDPGIGFGKRLIDNLAIIKNISIFKKLGCPILIGTSRKSFIGMVTGNMKNSDKRIGGSIASSIYAMLKGVDILRVHDVAATVEAVKVIKSIERGE
jgi:dihydropteroate synthase